MLLWFFFFNDPATTEIYALSLHDALPIYVPLAFSVSVPCVGSVTFTAVRELFSAAVSSTSRLSLFVPATVPVPSLTFSVAPRFTEYELLLAVGASLTGVTLIVRVALPVNG